MTTPFIIYALCRSKTAWLANFLSYKDWDCYHESAIFMRSMDDVRDFFSHSNVGCVETAAVQGRHLIRHAVPNIKEIVVLRPVNDVVESMMNVDISGVATYDRNLLEKNIKYADRLLRRVSKDPNVLVVAYEDLDKEETCAKIFEYCLPHAFDRAWWHSLRDKNIQVDVKAVIRYYHRNREAIESFKSHCRRELFRLFRSGEILAEKRT